MTIASIFPQIFDKVKAETQAKIVDKIPNKSRLFKYARFNV